MTGTREKILLTALRRFAADGYEAVSVSDIAGELGMTKGALYRHYRNKRDIFDSIIARMERRDAEQAENCDVPQGTLAEMEAAYRTTTVDSMVEFGKVMFRYWTQDDFAAPFRKMLTLEQFRDPEMGALYRQYLVSGPIGYLADWFHSLGFSRPQARAVEFYAPMFLLYSAYDGSDDRDAILSQLDDIMEDIRKKLKGEGTI